MPNLNTVFAYDGEAAAGKLVQGNDSRLSNARTPTTHNQAASTISDSTAAGRALLTAADAAAQRTALGVSSIALAAELWVSASGSDSTGTRGNPSLPFLTIGAAITAASAGDTIHIGAGTYAEQVNVSKSRLTLRGAGLYSAVISYSGTQVGITIASAVTDTVLENIEIDGQRTTSTEVSAYSNTEGCAILLAAGNHRTRINRVKVTNPGGYAIFSNNGTTSDDLTVTDCYLASVATSSTTLVAKEVRYGILNFGGVNHLYGGNFITGFSQAIGLWYGAAKCRVLANRAYYNFGKSGTGGTATRSACEDYGATASTHGNNLWHGNYVEGTTSKCFEIATGTVGSTYSNNVCTFVSSALNSNYNAFDLTSDSGEPTNRITIIGNTVNGGGLASGVGIQVSGALAGLSATGNTFNACGAHGVYIGGTSTAGGMTISGNTFRTCDLGIFLNNNGDGFTIADNAFINGANNQIDIRSGTGHSITGNSITGSTAGICLYILPAASRTIVSGNTIVSSSASVRGIYINASDCIITDNSVTLTARANQDSTCTIYNGNKNIVRNNVFNNTGGSFRYEVYFAGSCAENVVTDNRLVAGSAYSGDATGSNTIRPNITSSWLGRSPQYHSWVFDPKVVCDGAVDRFFLMSIGTHAPSGFVVTAWKLSCEADPTTELDIDLKRADAFIGVANAAVMDVLDTTAGASSESTAANINSGATVANGKVMYLEFGTAYTEANHQCVFELWGYSV